MRESLIVAAARRPTIADLAREAGVSVSTVDRVLTGRDPVREATARLVLEAAEKIGFYAVATLKQRLRTELPERTFGFLLQQPTRSFYRMLADALTIETEACASIRGRARVDMLEDLRAETVAERLLKLGRRCDALAVVAADHPRITAAVDQLARDGVAVFALISDLTAAGRAGYVGLDNWKVGRTAAWAIANMARLPGEVGIFVGSHRYRCQEVCEMSFRSYFREHAPRFRLLEPLTTFEEARYAHEAATALLRRHTGLVGLYVAGGGISGVIQALRDAGPDVSGRIVAVGHELMDTTRSALIDGVLKLVLSHPLQRLAAAVVAAMAEASKAAHGATMRNVQLPVDVFTSENV
jgi:LacI family transcriptional regulator